MDTRFEIDRRALELFPRLLELDSQDRAALDLEIASLEPALAARVQELMALHRSDTGRLDRHWKQLLTNAELPARLGAFTLVRELGRGGMGVVAEAQREAEGFTQRAAIKWIPAWQVDPARRQRFLFERDVVSRLRHPHIAQLVDGGESEHGELWYAMELVEGQNLLQHCRERSLSLQSRVHLLLDLCDAVAYAHHNLILHRDIKPSNVLVDHEGQLKLIDFGIAKGLDESNEGLTLDHAPMTPRYAAPEQLRGERPTTATDLWQIAAVGFELLTGVPARKDGQLRRTSLAAAEASAEHSASCGLDPLRLQKALRGDLDAILSKALREAPDQRYANVESLALDLRAWLNGHPVAVRRHERWYAARRFVSVHQWAVGFGMVALLALISGVVATSLMAAEARSEARIADRTADLLGRMLLSSDSSLNLLSMNLKDLVEHQVRQVIAATDIPPKRRIPMLAEFAMRAMEVGASSTAVEASKASVELARQHPSYANADIAVWMDKLATVLLLRRDSEGSLDEISDLLAESTEIHNRHGWEGATRTMIHVRAQAMLLEAQGLRKGAIEYVMGHSDMQGHLEPAPNERLMTLQSEAYRLGIMDRVNFYWWLGNLHHGAGDFAGALRMNTRALEILSLASTESPDTRAHAGLLHVNHCVFTALNKLSGAIESCQSASGELEGSGLSVDALRPGVEFGLGVAFVNRNEIEQAVQHFEEGLSYAERATEAGAQPAYVAATRRELGFAYLSQDRNEEAAQLLEQSMQFVRNEHERHSWYQMKSRIGLIEALVSLGRTEDARALLSRDLLLTELDDSLRGRWEALQLKMRGPGDET